MAVDDAIRATRGRALLHAVAREVAVVFADAAAAIEVVAVLIAAVAVTAEEALVAPRALTVLTGLAVVVVATERGSGGQHGEER